MKSPIQRAVSQLRKVVAQLRAAHPVRKFTLDGRLVGDIGEVLAAAHYEITLHEKQEKYYDATTADGRKVQIKATMLKSLTFPPDHVPDLYLGIKINEDGGFTEVFNGPGSVVRCAIENRKPTTRLHSISLTRLAQENAKVRKKDKIRRRST